MVTENIIQKNNCITMKEVQYYEINSFWKLIHTKQ